MNSKSILPIAIIGAGIYFIAKGANAAQAVGKLSVKGGKIKKVKFNGLFSIDLQIELAVNNPSSIGIPLDYYTGTVTHAGSQVADFTFNAQGKNVALAARNITPITFNVNISTISFVNKLINLVKDIAAGRAVDTKLNVSSMLYAGGLDLPVNFVHDLKPAVVSTVKGIAGIGSVGYPGEKEYFDRELMKGLRKYNAWASQRLGPYSKEQAQDLQETLATNKKWLLEKIDWLIDGSYGTEYQYPLKHWYRNIAPTDKRRAQGLRMIAINAFMLLCSSEYSELNAAKVRSIVKKAFSKTEMENFNQSIADAIEERALEDHWILTIS